MGIIHRRSGTGDAYVWEDVPLKDYPSGVSLGASVRWLIGRAEGAPHFAMRYFEVQPGGHTALDNHPHDHGVLVLRGQAEVLLGEQKSVVGAGDVVYIPGGETHQFHTQGDEPFGFICVIPSGIESAAARPASS
jgi:quercetin dioxygenase-like cupin family protein